MAYKSINSMLFSDYLRFLIDIYVYNLLLINTY
jgi:hypothetical protein